MSPVIPCCRWRAPAWAGTTSRAHRYILFTEADQIVHIRDSSRLLSVLDENHYLVPHRLERDYKGANRRGQPLVRLGTSDYVLWNHPGDDHVRSGVDGFFTAESRVVAYGAAWLASAKAVARADFLGPSNEPLEHPCHAMFERLNALKTSDVFDFFTEHLSGYDNALARFGLNVDDYPSFW